MHVKHKLLYETYENSVLGLRPEPVLICVGDDVFFDGEGDYVRVEDIYPDGLICGVSKNVRRGSDGVCYRLENMVKVRSFQDILLDGLVILDVSSVRRDTIIRAWFSKGTINRLDGPAIIYPDGSREWWVDGEKLPVNTQKEADAYFAARNAANQLPRQDILNLETAVDPSLKVDNKGGIVITEGNLVYTDRFGDFFRITYISQDGMIGGWYDDTKGPHSRPTYCLPVDISAVKDTPTSEAITLNGLVVFKTTTPPKVSEKIYVSYLDGQPHSLNGPAVVYPDGRKEWWADGKSLPVNSQKDYEAWLKIRLHSDKLPHQDILNLESSVEEEKPTPRRDSSGTITWKLKNGKVHRVDGPAFEYKDGSVMWFKNDARHRDDGPAVIFRGPDGDRMEWWVNGKRHRSGGPAIIEPDGSKEWWVNGTRHREGAPAVIYSNGANEWYRNGLLHRLDGPAIVAPDIKEWWVNGKHHREGGPASEHQDGSREWWVNGKRHREDGPAVEYRDGDREWWVNGKLHRLDGPAVAGPDHAERWDKSKKWYINGDWIPVTTQEEFENYIKVHNITRSLPNQDILDL